MLRRFLFETKLGDLVLWLFEQLTGFALVELEELESWQYELTEPTPARQR
jgi:hypothetical protein